MGFESVALFPIYVGEDRFGLLQLNDRRKGLFSPQSILLWERLAGYLATAVSKFQAEEALQESEQKLGLFVEHAPVALAMFDGEMRYLFASRRWIADHGHGGRELCGVLYYDLFPEIPEQWKETHRRGLAGEVLSCDADRFTRADGSEQWIRWEIRPWRNAEGEIGGIVIFSEEITERKNAEAALLRNEKLTFQRQQLQALFLSR